MHLDFSMHFQIHKELFESASFFRRVSILFPENRQVPVCRATSLDIAKYIELYSRTRLNMLSTMSFRILRCIEKIFSEKFLLQSRQLQERKNPDQGEACLRDGPEPAVPPDPVPACSGCCALNGQSAHYPEHLLSVFIWIFQCISRFARSCSSLLLSS